MAGLRFELVSPEKLLFSGDVDSVVVPSAEGEFMVMANHAPVMASLRPGVVTVGEAGKTSKLYVRGGFAEVSEKGLTILAEEALPLEQLDAAKLDLQVKNAEEDVADAKDAEAKRLADEKLAQLRDLRAALRM